VDPSAATCGAVFFAKLIADRIKRGIFETYLHLACVPFIPEPMTSSRVASMTNQLTVAEVMATGITALPPLISISELLHILKTTKFQVRL
jgi:hypothetical protein